MVLPNPVDESALRCSSFPGDGGRLEARLQPGRLLDAHPEVCRRNWSASSVCSRVASTGTDLDWVVEVGGGGVLVWEWKRPEAQPPNDAQERALVALSDPLTPTVVMQLTGDVATLTPQHVKVWRDGPVGRRPTHRPGHVRWSGVGCGPRKQIRLGA